MKLGRFSVQVAKLLKVVGGGLRASFAFVLMLGHGRHDIDLGRGLSCSLKVVPGAA
jgi:hypothetical protein